MTFLPQFKSCVEAGSWSLMCSYNRFVYKYCQELQYCITVLLYSINGVPACANSKLLTDILRNEWNFKGYVVSDNEALGKTIELQDHAFIIILLYS